MSVRFRLFWLAAAAALAMAPGLALSQAYPAKPIKMRYGKRIREADIKAN